MCFRVSGFQGFGFHPNRYRYRYRYRDRLLNLKRAVEPSTLFGFRVSRFQGFIQIAIAIGIAIGIDYLTTNTRDGTARVFLERQREFLIFMKFHVFHGSIPIGIAIGIAIGIDRFKVSGFQ
jgi:hypothetical protein